MKSSQGRFNPQHQSQFLNLFIKRIDQVIQFQTSLPLERGRGLMYQAEHWDIDLLIYSSTEPLTYSAQSRQATGTIWVLRS